MVTYQLLFSLFFCLPLGMFIHILIFLALIIISVQVAYSNTRNEFEENWEVFRSSWNENHANSIEFLSMTLINPHKEKFVRAWTNSIWLFGQTVTSRGEGDHSIVKEFIASSMENLLECCERIIQSIESFQIEYITALAKAENEDLTFWTAYPTWKHSSRWQ